MMNGLMGTVISQVNLVNLQWDAISFFKNSRSYAETIGGGLLTLLGTIAIIWGAVKLLKKLMGGQGAQQESWIMIILLIIVGGALATGGFALMSDIASGGEKTIKDLGGGIIMLPYYFG